MIKTIKGIPIKDQKLLTTSLTHRSWLNENKNEKNYSNERLEFLGDAVLELIITEYLYQKYPNQQEGSLTALRASLVKTETLAKVAKNLKLGKFIKLSKGEELGGGRNNQGLLADTFESIIGAIYLENGYKKAQKFVQKHLTPELKIIIARHLQKDAKSLLQEKVQAKGLETPIYKVLEETGPDHDKNFTVAVILNNKQISVGSGKSKQQAQQNAAHAALEKLNLS